MLRRRAPLLVAFAVLGAAIALVTSLAQSKIYEASASLLFEQSNASQVFNDASQPQVPGDASRAIATTQRLVSLPVIDELTARHLHNGMTAGEIAGKINVETREVDDLATISARDTSPARAAQIANAFAQSFIDFRKTSERSKTEGAQRLIARQLRELTPAQRSSQEGRALTERSNELKILAALQTGNAELVQPALVPGAPVAPRTKLNTLLGLIFGLVVGVGVVFMLDRLDRRLKETDDIERLAGRPLIAAIPKSRRDPKSGPLPALSADPIMRESFRMLRANLRYFHIDSPMSVILVTSPSPEDGKTTVAWNLAAVAAVGGARTLLIESDMREPEVAARWHVPPSGGLCETLTSGLPLEQAVAAVSLDGAIPHPASPSEAEAVFDVLVAGGVPPDPSELLDSTSMRNLMAAARERYDLVVVDTPPVRIVPDAIPLISMADGVLIVARANKTTKEQLSALIDQLEKLRAPVTGVVLNAVRRAGDSYGYGYGYGHPRTEQEQPVGAGR